MALSYINSTVVVYWLTWISHSFSLPVLHL